MAQAVPVFSLWVEGALGRLERMCLNSFVQNGHPVALYTYGEVAGIPPGVERRDARGVLDEKTIAEVGTGRTPHAIAADIFRYRGLALGLGLWADTDFACLRPIVPKEPLCVGDEGGGVLNNAVLRIDPGHPIVRDALAYARPGGLVPFWISGRSRRKLLFRRLVRRPLTLAELPWGTFGPQMMTALVSRAGLASQAEPHDVFYPLSWRRAEAAFDGSIRLEDCVTENTLGIHLWNERVRAVKHVAPVPGSIFETLCRRYDPAD